ncbi:hypothetical protein EVB55_113 [Rhizobium phage RHph_Y68]|uniref:Uncharacterized protein n=1 Tax=Rhizobium phage RHph_Y68 TaxID=2509787 RepID=A0A7S5UUE9_9CAUD|nr:hypothetical protein PP934_gp113 [Rhizobium phage RHph_Y68]QIG68048.1 hypothetical protein EVB55_113 [Rhizobium phage RHph_Y68]
MITETYEDFQKPSDRTEYVIYVQAKIEAGNERGKIFTSKMIHRQITDPADIQQFIDADIEAVKASFPGSKGEFLLKTRKYRVFKVNFEEVDINSL